MSHLNFRAKIKVKIIFVSQISNIWIFPPKRGKISILIFGAKIQISSTFAPLRLFRQFLARKFKVLLASLAILKNETFLDFFLRNFQTFTVPGGCSQGSPSTCMGNLLLTLTMTWLHWANRLPEDRRPVRTCPIWRQFSKPTTSMSLSPISVMESKAMKIQKIVLKPPKNYNLNYYAKNGNISFMMNFWR